MASLKSTEINGALSLKKSLKISTNYSYIAAIVAQEWDGNDSANNALSTVTLLPTIQNTLNDSLTLVGGLKVAPSVIQLSRFRIKMAPSSNSERLLSGYIRDSSNDNEPKRVFTITQSGRYISEKSEYGKDYRRYEIDHTNSSESLVEVLGVVLAGPNSNDYLATDTTDGGLTLINLKRGLYSSDHLNGVDHFYIDSNSFTVYMPFRSIVEEETVVQNGTGFTHMIYHHRLKIAKSDYAISPLGNGLIMITGTLAAVDPYNLIKRDSEFVIKINKPADQLEILGVNVSNVLLDANKIKSNPKVPTSSFSNLPQWSIYTYFSPGSRSSLKNMVSITPLADIRDYSYGGEGEYIASNGFSYSIICRYNGDISEFFQ